MNTPVDRKTLRNPDEFVKRGRSALSFILERQKLFWGLLGVVIVAVTIHYAVSAWKKSQLNRGWNDVYAAMKLPDNEQTEALRKVYQKEFPRRPAIFAAVTLADRAFSGAKKLHESKSAELPAKVDEAAEWYNNALQVKNLSGTERQLLLLNRGQSFELKRDLDAALQEFQKALNETGDVKGLVLLNIGRIEELKMDSKAALRTFERVISEFANSEYARLAKNYVRRLKSPLLN